MLPYMFSKKQSLFYQIFKNSQGEKKLRLGWRLGENRVVLNNSVYQGNFVKKHVACIHDY